ncbi:uncharacterized protein LOC129928834 [Biomphalaria glabrata]|uniref:Uncharacterized protein LOC129928833 n=1 Tax=Biomphalaria glabrata TaxID=6526 RepID=A0A9W3BNX2_BIOGL|nr:uncharacterized protein LOC129928833 [Biomphalaria glabrata]XP_055901127.1 uncharacterized protein LOC129928834 [Biomphalaria glabrata]
MASGSRTQRLLELMELAKEKQIPKPDLWAERQEDKEAEKQREYQAKEHCNMTLTTDIIGEAIALAEKLNIPSHERERWFDNKLAEIDREDDKRRQEELKRELLKLKNTEFKAEQKNDATLTLLYQEASLGCSVAYFEDGFLKKTSFHKCNVIEQIYVPLKYRKQILEAKHEFHYTIHKSVTSTKKRIAKEYYWPSLNKDVKKYINNCSHCQHDYCEKKQTQKKSNITKTKKEPDYKVRIDNNESMNYDSSKSTGTSLPTTCPYLPVTTCPSLPATSSTCPSLPDNTSPPLPSTFPSLTTDDDFIHQDLNKTASASNTMVCIEHFCYNQGKSHEPEPEADTYIQSTLAIPDKRKTFQLDSTTHTSIPHLKECESTKEAITTKNIESQRILHEHMKSRYFAQGDQVNLLLPDWSNKLFYKWQGPFHITRKISNLLYEINVNKVTRVFHVHMFEHYHETDNEDIKAEVEFFPSLAPIPEQEEETSSTPIPEIDVSLPASNQIDIPKVITLDDIALQKVKDTKVFPDHADFFTGVSETFPVLQFESYSESNNIDNTKFHPPSTQGATFLQKGTNELLQHCCIDRLNSDLFSHCSIEHSNAKHSATIVLQRQSSSTRKLSFGFGQFLFSPNSNAIQSEIICEINMTWRQQLHKLKDLFFKFRKQTYTSMTAIQKGSELNISILHIYYSIFSVT